MTNVHGDTDFAQAERDMPLYLGALCLEWLSGRPAAVIRGSK